jgi:hypothetical protein
MGQRYGILAPSGAFGNHLRWLLSLDQQFTVNFGSSLAEVQQCMNQLVNVSDLTLTTNSPEEKVRNIAALVYPEQRTWHNWLAFEWAFSDNLTKLIYFDHGNEDGWKKINTPTTNYRAVLCTIDPDLAYRCYVKWNSALNNTPIHSYKTRIAQNFNAVSYTQKLCKMDNPAACYFVDTSILFQPTLDKSFYQSIISFCQLDDQYELASDVHKLWYDLQIAAEHDMIRDLTTTFNLKESQ